jgi:hypothetical protein
MNYLQLGQRMVSDCGISGTLSTMQSQTGEFLRVTNWINQAWEELQTKHDDWEWMKSSFLLGGGVSFVTVAAQASYPLGAGAGTVGLAATSFGKWDINSFRNFNTVAGFAGEIFMDPITFESWRNSYMYGSMRSVKTRPVAVAIGPDKSVCVGPPSDGSWTVNGDYWQAPTLMAADIDVPTNLPAQFHMAIVYSAMMMYGAYEAASEVYARGETGYNKLMAELEVNYAPRIGFAGALC